MGRPLLQRGTCPPPPQARPHLPANAAQWGNRRRAPAGADTPQAALQPQHASPSRSLLRALLRTRAPTSSDGQRPPHKPDPAAAFALDALTYKTTHMHTYRARAHTTHTHTGGGDTCAAHTPTRTQPRGSRAHLLTQQSWQVLRIQPTAQPPGRWRCTARSRPPATTRKPCSSTQRGAPVACSGGEATAKACRPPAPSTISHKVASTAQAGSCPMQPPAGTPSHLHTHPLSTSQRRPRPEPSPAEQSRAELGQQGHAH